MIASQHTCAFGDRESCTPCVKFEVDLWDAINRYAISVGGDPASHVYGNAARMQAVADVGKIVDRVAARQRIDDLVVDELAKGGNAAAAAACERGGEVKHLKRLYAESRDYVATLERERDALVVAANQSVGEHNQLDAEVALLRPVYAAAKRVRESLPASAGELRDRAFRPATVDLIDAVDRAIAAESTPYRGAP